VFVGDGTGRRIVEVAPNGVIARTWGKEGSDPGQFKNSIGGIAVGPNGNIYASDTWNHRMQEFSPTGTLLRAWGGPNPDLANSKLPHTAPQPNQFYGAAWRRRCSQWQCLRRHTGNERIQVFNPDGKFLFAFGKAGSGTGALTSQVVSPSTRPATSTWPTTGTVE